MDQHAPVAASWALRARSAGPTPTLAHPNGRFGADAHAHSWWDAIHNRADAFAVRLAEGRHAEDGAERGHFPHVSSDGGGLVGEIWGRPPVNLSAVSQNKCSVM